MTIQQQIKLETAALALLCACGACAPLVVLIALLYIR